MVQTSPVTKESAKKPVKTIVQGMPVASGVPVVTNARAIYTPRAAAGALGIRHSLRPLNRRDGVDAATRARSMRRENADAYLSGHFA
jgi:hypothetical protein